MNKGDADYTGPNCGYALYGEPAICTCGTCDVTQEAADTALTDYLGGRQPVLEPVEALLGHQEE